MKNILYACLLLLCFSCERIFINGELDGMWRLQRVASADEVACPDSIFYSFQRHLVMMGIYSETEHPKNYYMGRFQYDGDSIVMDNLYRYPGQDGVCVPQELENLYIFDTTARFKVERLDSKKMILSSFGREYSFIKW